MDPLINKLNDAVQKSIQSASEFAQAPSVGTGSSNGTVGGFSATFDQKMTDRLLEKLQENYGTNQQANMTVIPAEDVHVQTVSGELARSPRVEGAGDKFYDMFSKVNRDLVGLDSAMEILTSPGVKISPNQLLAMQAGIANTSLVAESFTKLTDGIAKSIQSIIQNPVG